MQSSRMKYLTPCTHSSPPRLVIELRRPTWWILFRIAIRITFVTWNLLAASLSKQFTTTNCSRVTYFARFTSTFLTNAFVGCNFWLEKPTVRNCRGSRGTGSHRRYIGKKSRRWWRQSSLGEICRQIAYYLQIASARLIRHLSMRGLPDHTVSRQLEPSLGWSLSLLKVLSIVNWISYDFANLFKISLLTQWETSVEFFQKGRMACSSCLKLTPNVSKFSFFDLFFLLFSLHRLVKTI